MKNIAVICGGSGGYQVLKGLSRYNDVVPHAVVTMADNGGSTGVLRTSMGVLPPGDVRRALVALSGSEEVWRQLFAHRFEGVADDHSLGNLILAALEKITGDFNGAVKVASELLQVRGTVNPATLTHIDLCVRYANGKVVCGESAVDKAIHESESPVEEAWLEPEGIINPQAYNILLSADLIVIGPGDLYTSIVPALLVKGMKEALSKSKAPKVYVSNLMTKKGETNGFQVQDFVSVVSRYIGYENIQYVLYNTKRPPLEVLERYKTNESAEFVVLNPEKPTKGGVVYQGENLIDSGDIVRHSPEAIAHYLHELASEN